MKVSLSEIGGKEKAKNVTLHILFRASPSTFLSSPLVCHSVFELSTMTEIGLFHSRAWVRRGSQRWRTSPSLFPQRAICPAGHWRRARKPSVLAELLLSAWITLYESFYCSLDWFSYIHVTWYDDNTCFVKCSDIH